MAIEDVAGCIARNALPERVVLLVLSIGYTERGSLITIQSPGGLDGWSADESLANGTGTKH